MKAFISSLTKSALLAQVSAKLHNQASPFFWPYVGLVHFQGFYEIILCSIFEYVANILLKLTLAANRICVRPFLLRRFPSTRHV